MTQPTGRLPRKVMVRRERFRPDFQPWIDMASCHVEERDDETHEVLGRWSYGGVAIVRPSTGRGVFVGVRNWIGPSPRLVWALAHPLRAIRSALRRKQRTLVVDTRQALADDHSNQQDRTAR